jgi:hypothetical protein
MGIFVTKCVELLAFDRWFEHAGFVNGTFFDDEKPGCVLSDTSSCGTQTVPGGEW